MQYNELKESIEIFDNFVNKGISANLEEINPIEVVRAYNKIRDFINENAEFDKD